MPDETTLKWQSVLEVLSDSTELSTGKLSIIRMTRVIDVDGTLVLVAGSPFTKSKVEEARATISRALTQVWGRDVPFEVTVDTSLDAGTPAPTMAVTRPPTQHVAPRVPDLSSALAESDAPEPVVRARPSAVEPPTASGASGTTGRHALQSVQPTRSGRPGHSSHSAAPSYVTNPAAAFARPEGPQSFDKSSHLNPRYTFDNYVIAPHPPTHEKACSPSWCGSAPGPCIRPRARRLRVLPDDRRGLRPHPPARENCAPIHGPSPDAFRTAPVRAEGP